jgi:hypothetical protein
MGLECGRHSINRVWMLVVPVHELRVNVDGLDVLLLEGIQMIILYRIWAGLRWKFRKLHDRRQPKELRLISVRVVTS